MGQSISVAARSVDDFCVFTTDRVLTGQDGARYESADEAESGDGFPSILAARLFAADSLIQSVWVAASEVVVERAGGWGDADTERAQQVITDLYRFYD